MALVLQDRVKESSASSGTGSVVLTGAFTGYRTFASCIPDGSTVYYCIHNLSVGAENEWEVGLGTYTLSTTTLARTTVLSSSNANSLVNFTAGANGLEVFITYPAEKAIYEEADGKTLINAGPITVVGSNVTSYTSLNAALGEFYANLNNFAQVYAQNQSSGSDASTDFVVENDNGTDTEFYGDFGINSSGFNSPSYPIFTPNSGYIYSIGDGASNTSTFFVGSGDGEVVVHAGGFNTNNTVAVFGTDLSTELKGALTVPGTTTINGTATFGSTVTLNANPTLALQAATKQYVDNQVTAGLHIHDPVRVETTGNLTATYAQGGTTFNITDITSTTTVTTSTTHGLSVNDQIWLTGAAGNGLSANTAYFVYSVPANNQLTLSLTFGGAQITGLTNAAGLTYPVRANSGVGATLTNSGAQSALTIDNVAMATTNRVMVRLQTNGAENGVYTVTDAGSGSTNWVLTRATDSNKVNPADPNGVGTGDYYFTQEGALNAGDSHVLTTEPNTMIIGYTPLTYTQFSGSVDYTGGTNINISGQTISLTGTVAPTNGGTGTNTVTTGDLLYGSGTNTWGKLAAGAQYKSLVMGASTPEWNAVALNQSGAVSGVLPEANGGTNNSTYVTGDTLYASGTNTLGKLGPNTTTTKKFLSQTGTGSAGQAPAWAQPAASDITGLAASATTDTTNASNISSGTLDNARTSASSSNGASTIVARDASGNFSANTITANVTGNISGSAATLTTARNFQISGGATAANVSFDGSAAVNLNVTAMNASVINTGTIANIYTTASSSNGASTIVARDASGNFTANNVTATNLIGTLNGSGANVTTINASNISTGTLANARTTASDANGASTIVARDASGNFTGNTITAVTGFSGPGGSLTALNATALSSGTVNTARVSGSYTGITGVGTLVAGTWNANAISDTYLSTISTAGKVSNSATTASSSNGASTIVARDASGNFSAGTVTATFSGSGAAVTSLNASAISSGTVPTAHLASGTANNTTYLRGDSTWAALSAPNNGTLTMNVSGTGLSGSATFTADQSGNSTFTVTSNASSANGSSTIVARDASGNFSANTITANLTGNASGSAATFTSTTQNSQFNSVGVGTAGSGTAGEIRATNNITAYYSDDRLKTRLGTIDNALGKLKTLEGFYYEANETAQAFGYEVKKEVGVSAQQVQAVMPEVVAPAPIDDKYLTVRYERLVPLLIEAIKELEAQVAELKGK